jgi:N-acetylglutamate synthase-like GNAT family acetyltransferase
MYRQFEPKGEFQGLPPRTASQIKKWLAQLCECGFNQFVIEVGDRIVGHAALCPSQRKTEAELAIFLHQDYRGYGLGKKLLLGTLNFGCKKLELARVWLFVMGSNMVASHLFESIGFRPGRGGDPLAWEIEMDRPSHCTKCKGNKCTIFGGALPITVDASVRRQGVCCAKPQSANG